jgi:hypothetical protein
MRTIRALLLLILAGGAAVPAVASAAEQVDLLLVAQLPFEASDELGDERLGAERLRSEALFICWCSTCSDPG